MAEKHPYMSGAGGLLQTVTQFRKALPAKVSAETLKKLGIAPNNESFVINILRFVGILEPDGRPSEAAKTVLTQYEDAEFQKGLAALVKAAYKDLFALHGEDGRCLAPN